MRVLRRVISFIAKAKAQNNTRPMTRMIAAQLRMKSPSVPVVDWPADPPPAGLAARFLGSDSWAFSPYRGTDLVRKSRYSQQGHSGENPGRAEGRDHDSVDTVVVTAVSTVLFPSVYRA